MDYVSISDAIRRFILDHFPSARRRVLDDAEPLLENGIIDSLGVLDLVAFIESNLEVVVDDEELTAENFQNISCIAAYVEKRRTAFYDANS
jgi:acyl carrier protein